MGQLNLSATDFQSALTTGNWAKVFAALQFACQRHDFNSGWVAYPVGGIVRHSLGVLPAAVQVHGAATADGTNFQNVGFTAASTQSLTVAAGTAYIRVICDR